MQSKATMRYSLCVSTVAPRGVRSPAGTGVAGGGGEVAVRLLGSGTGCDDDTPISSVQSRIFQQGVPNDSRAAARVCDFDTRRNCWARAILSIKFPR
jgi:hypothetical protein